MQGVGRGLKKAKQLSTLNVWAHILRMLQISVMISVVANLIVVLVLWARRKRLKATHWFVVALALSDICFSLLLHPMLVATSFGSDADQLFTKTGRVYFQIYQVVKNCKARQFSLLMSSPLGITNFCYYNTFCFGMSTQLSNL